MRLTGRTGAVALALLIGVVLAGCSGPGDQGDSSEAEMQDVAQDLGGGDSDGGGAGGGGVGSDELTATGAVVAASAPEPTEGAPDARANRLQTFTAQVVLGVDQLEGAVAEASEAIESLGGFAADEEVDLAGSERATVVYRVPAAEFRPALEALGEVGALRSQTIASEDVTAQYSDLESRVATLRTSITRLQGFLAETTDVNQVAALEGELTRREAELESIESQRRALADQVELSTITVELDAARGSERVVAEDRPGFRGGLDAGVDTAGTLVAVAATTAGFLLPLLPLVAVVALLVWWIRRRRRNGAAAAAGDRAVTEE